MPVAFDTQEIFRYVLSTDRSKPEGERPTLLFYFPTCKETRQIAKLYDESYKTENVDEIFDKRSEAIKLILCGWQNFKDRAGNPVAYNPDDLDKVITSRDYDELHQVMLKDMSLAEVEKKRFALTAPSHSNNSAPSVTGSVSTSQASTNPQS